MRSQMTAIYLKYLYTDGGCSVYVAGCGIMYGVNIVPLHAQYEMTGRFVKGKRTLKQDLILLFGPHKKTQNFRLGFSEKFLYFADTKKRQTVQYGEFTEMPDKGNRQYNTDSVISLHGLSIPEKFLDPPSRLSQIEVCMTKHNPPAYLLIWPNDERE